MKASHWVRLFVLAFAVMSVAGVMAVVACGPSAPLAPPNGAGNVSDSVSLPATEAPLVLPQSGDGGQVEPTEVPTETPTAEPTDEPTENRLQRNTFRPRLTHHCARGLVPRCIARRMGIPSLSTGCVGITTTRCSRTRPAVFAGMLGNFRNWISSSRPVRLTGLTKWRSFCGAMVLGLRYSALYKEPDGSRGSVHAMVNLSLLPQLVAIESVKWVHEDLNRKYLHGARMVLTGVLWMMIFGRFMRLLSVRTLIDGRVVRRRCHPVIRVRIKIDSALAVYGVLRHLRSNGGENVVWKKVEGSTGDPDGSSTVEADVDVDVLIDIRWLNGVREIKEIQEASKVPAGWHSGFGGSAGRDAVEPPSGPSAAFVSAQADQWHRAGYTGAGVGVAVLDTGFRDFKTQVLPFLSAPVRYLCHSSAYSNPPPVRVFCIPMGRSWICI